MLEVSKCRHNPILKPHTQQWEENNDIIFPSVLEAKGIVKLILKINMDQVVLFTGLPGSKEFYTFDEKHGFCVQRRGKGLRYKHHEVTDIK